MQLKDPSLAPESPEEARRPCTTAGIWHFMYNADLKIADVWFLRELFTDEFYRKARTNIKIRVAWTPAEILEWH